MNSYTIVLLSFCFFIGTKFDHLVAELVGLRCEFNGTMEFVIKKRVAASIEEKLSGCKRYDSLKLDEIKIVESRNGFSFHRYRLCSNQWVFLDDGISVRISLKPNSLTHVFGYEDVYFFNIFARSLYFKLDQSSFEKLKDSLCIGSDNSLWRKLAELNPRFDSEDCSYQIILSHGYALKYPVGSRVAITLETYDRK